MSLVEFIEPEHLYFEPLFEGTFVFTKTEFMTIKQYCLNILEPVLITKKKVSQISLITINTYEFQLSDFDQEEKSTSQILQFRFPKVPAKILCNPGHHITLTYFKLKDDYFVTISIQSETQYNNQLKLLEKRTEEEREILLQRKKTLQISKAITTIQEWFDIRDYKAVVGV